jgi:hypothetical protein
LVGAEAPRLPIITVRSPAPRFRPSGPYNKRATRLVLRNWNRWNGEPWTLGLIHALHTAVAFPSSLGGLLSHRWWRKRANLFRYKHYMSRRTRRRENRAPLRTLVHVPGEHDQRARSCS